MLKWAVYPHTDQSFEWVPSFTTTDCAHFDWGIWRVKSMKRRDYGSKIRFFTSGGWLKISKYHLITLRFWSWSARLTCVSISYWRVSYRYPALSVWLECRAHGKGSYLENFWLNGKRAKQRTSYRSKMCIEKNRSCGRSFSAIFNQSRVNTRFGKTTQIFVPQFQKWRTACFRRLLKNSRMTVGFTFALPPIA